MIRMPNFFIVGAPKTGSTAVYHQLRAHPDIYMSPVKEPRFFCRKHRRNVSSVQDYDALFRDAKAEAIVGEASVGYLHSPPAAERIKAYAPTAKILVLIRQPVVRAHSHYCMMRNSGEAAEFSSFRKASEAAAEALRRGTLPPAATGYTQSFYASALRRYIDLFDDDVLVVLHDDLVHDKVNTYRRILAFLGVDPTYTPIELNRTYNVGYGNPRSGVIQRGVFNKGRFKKAIKALVPKSVRRPVRDAVIRLNHIHTTPLTRRDLLTYTPLFEDDILATSRLTDRDLNDWLMGETVPLPQAGTNRAL